MVITNKTCPRCHVVYSTKSGLNFHLNRKVPCTVIDKEVNDKPDDVVNILKKMYVIGAITNSKHFKI